MCGTLTKRTSRHDVRENSVRITKRTMKFTWWKRPVPWLILRNRLGRPEDGSSREKAEAPAEVAADAESRKNAPPEVAGAASVEVAADVESHKNAPAEVAAGAA